MCRTAGCPLRSGSTDSQAVRCPGSGPREAVSSSSSPEASSAGRSEAASWAAWTYRWRSEERRVGEEGRSRWAPYHLKKKKKNNGNDYSIKYKQIDKINYHEH